MPPRSGGSGPEAAPRGDCALVVASAICIEDLHQTCHVGDNHDRAGNDDCPTGKWPA